MLRPHKINLHGPPPMSVFHDSICENCAVICVNFHGGSYYWVLKSGTVFYAFTKFTNTLHNYYHAVIEQQVNFLIHYESVATKSIVHILHMQPQSLDFLLFYRASLASSLLLLNPDLPICFTAFFFFCEYTPFVQFRDGQSTFTLTTTALSGHSAHIEIQKPVCHTAQPTELDYKCPFCYSLPRMHSFS